MKTIFIPIFYKQQARNVLETDIFRILAGDSELRLILVTPAFKRNYFQRFSRPNVIIESVDEASIPPSRLDLFFKSLALNYIDTDSLRMLRRDALLKSRRGTRYAVRRVATYLLSRLSLMKRLFRFLDAVLVQAPLFDELFARYHPTLVFLPHLASKFDQVMLRSARRRRILTIGAIHSWDNITSVKNPIRLLPDYIIAYNEVIRNEAIRYLDYSPERITVTGLSHYDYYLTSQRKSREEFFRRLGLDPQKRLILFGPAGSSVSDTDWQVVSVLQDAVADGRLPNTQILVREHLVSAMIRGELKSSPFVHFDTPFTELAGQGRAFREITHGDMEHLADTIFWSDVTINICSTLSIDAAAFDKPVVNVAFDGWEKRPYKKSIRRLYDQNHYRAIIKTGGVRLARNAEELISYTQHYLADPSLDREGRTQIVREQCWKLDGKAGERIANLLLKEMEKIEKRNEERK